MLLNDTLLFRQFFIRAFIDAVLFVNRPLTFGEAGLSFCFEEVVPAKQCISKRLNPNEGYYY